MVNNVEYASGRSQFSSGREIGEYTSGPVCASHVARIKISAKCARWIYSLDYQCKSGIKDVGRTANTCLTKISQVRIIRK